MRVTAAALALLITACASVAPRVAVSGVADRLYCGRNVEGRAEVSDAEVGAFLDEVVEPRFPEGYTVWTAVGHWKGGEEKSLVLEMVHPYGSTFDRKVREIADEYRRRFHQAAVLRTTSPALMELIDE
ncbi:MAG: DUF3574 domain-containing protein [Acidobacteriota bacterium]